MKWINASNIKSWANEKQRHCQDTLPELVRRLILAHTANAVEEFDFPSGDSVATGGWDGRLKTPVVSPFFPNGQSGWEFGTEKSAQTKAEGDFNKRTADSLGLAFTDTTFVFVTPRAWPGRIKWQDSKRLTGIWKDVRVINADGLEYWLETAPAVALWLARQLGIIVSGGIRDIEAFWEEWSIGTKPVMTPALVIGGRTKNVETVNRWILEKPGILEVQADHPDEALAFLYASVATLPETERLQALSRCVIVENINELRQLTLAFQNYPLIIVAPGECINAAHLAISKGHHVYINMDATVIGINDNILRLARPQRNIVEKILIEGGLSEAEAQSKARDSGRSIPVLRRQLFQANAVSAPAWANAQSAQLLIPALFANAWDEQRKGDVQVIESLASVGYDDFVKEITPLLSIDDSPIRKVGSVWMIKSPLDTWFLLAPYLTQDLLNLFKKSLLDVLTKIDPKYELEAEKRWMSAIYDKSNLYSEWLRTGLVESLVLIAVYNNRSSDIVSTQVFADSIVKSVFTKADKWEAWASIKDATALLSEASPDIFMEAVEQGIKDNLSAFQDLMKDDPGIFDECKHSGLLWALESIAWSSLYFARAVNILVSLAEIDKGGKWSNRALNSLNDIFLPGFPQTHAKPKERLEVLGKILAKNPRITWKFAQRYYNGGTFSESHRFRWRDSDGNRRGLEREMEDDCWEYLKGLLPVLKNLACMRENIVNSMGEFIRLPADVREKILVTLESMDSNVLLKEERDLLLKETRGALNWINSYGEKDQLAYVPSLNKILEKFAPVDVLERVGWLLSDPWPRLPQGESENYDAENGLIKKAQEDAAREVLDKTSLENIIEYAHAIQYQGVLGHALARAINNEKEDVTLLDALLEYSADLPLLVRGYALGRVEVVGSSWIDQQINRIKIKGNYSHEACALLYFGIPESVSTWSAVSSRGKEVEKAYWKQASGYTQTDNNDDASIAIEKLLDVNRPDMALKIAGNHRISVPSILLQRLLLELLNMDERNSQIGAMDEYHLGNVFKQLYGRNELSIEEIVKLEWPFAELFDEFKKYTSSPMAIHRALQKDPQFFAQLISFAYKRDDHTPDPDRKVVTKEIAENRARVAYKVLDSWHLMPGANDGGTINEEMLFNWVEEARKQCEETNHTIGCDIHIGFLLAHAPSDPDGTWPHISVRNLIEHLNSEVIDRHIQTGIYNSRGVVSRGLNDGGKQERELVKRYKEMSESVKTKWPRTSAMLRGIADSYEHQARLEDIDSDLHDLLWD